MHLKIHGEFSPKKDLLTSGPLFSLIDMPHIDKAPMVAIGHVEAYASSRGDLHGGA